jgi:hypothetical protein
MMRQPGTIPDGWADCASDSNFKDRYLRISPNGFAASLPASGGTFTPVAKPGYEVFTYDGGRPADPGDSRKSPSPFGEMKIDLPAFSYVSCIIKK